MSNLTPVPSIDELLADPSQASKLSPDAARTLLIGLATIHPLLIARSLADLGKVDVETPDKFLTVEEAVSTFGITKQWLYRHKKQLPHSQPSRKVLLFPEDKLRRWFAARKTG